MISQFYQLDRLVVEGGLSVSSSSLLDHLPLSPFKTVGGQGSLLNIYIYIYMLLQGTQTGDSGDIVRQKDTG